MNTRELKFTVPGNPAGKGRPRYTRGGHAYTPDKTRRYENMVALAFREAYPDWIPTENPVIFAAKAYFDIPISWPKKKQKKARDGLLMYTKKPDTDNISKVKDALNGIAWRDDAQIFRDTIIKEYADDGRPRLEVQIIVVDEEEEEDHGSSE